MKRFLRVVVAAACILAAACQAIGQDQPGPQRFIEAVRQFAEHAIAHGRDTYGPVHTPMFVDGLNVDTLEPVTWKHKGQTWIMSNGASQQNFFRTLVGLSALTGEPKYRSAAVEAMKYIFENLRSENGLIHWGGHTFYDAGTEKIVGEGYRHELKYNLPFYEFMWDVDPAATKQYIEAVWGAHILNWSNLDMNRHGKYDRVNEKLWDNKYGGGPIFCEGDGLTFLSSGTDLIYAGAMLTALTNETPPLAWATKLASRYVQTRNPKTGMGGMQYNRYRRGDRAYVQFAQDLPGHLVYEGTLNVPRVSSSVTGSSALVKLRLSEKLGKSGEHFKRWAVEDLKAFKKWAFDEQECAWIPVLSDGTNLEGFEMKRKGYYRPEHKHFQKQPVYTTTFWSCALGWRLSGDEQLWDMARTIGLKQGIGDIGETPAGPHKLNLSKSGHASPNILFGLLEVYAKTRDQAYLKMAEGIGENMLKKRFHKKLFPASKKHVYARLDAVDPLALLHLAAAIQNRPDLVPDYWGGSGVFHCNYDGAGRTYDREVFYKKLKRPNKGDGKK